MVIAPFVPAASAVPAATAGRESRADAVAFARFALPAPRPGVAEDVAADCAGDPDLALLAPCVDAAFYRAGLADPAVAINPVRHFHEHGWRAGHDPNPWFDTAYYLDINADVREAGIDPLLHYLRTGRNEARPPRRPGGADRATVEAAKPPTIPVATADLDALRLAAALQRAGVGLRGMVLAIDGAAPTAIVDEEAAAFGGDGIVYLLATPAGDGLLRLRLDGRALGVAEAPVLATVLGDLPAECMPARLLVVHSPRGHDAASLAALAAALRPRRSFFWLHDHSALCAGGRLLRNDATPCGAPLATSMVCRICVHGRGRTTWLEAMRMLFARVAFDVLAPSEAALAYWRAHAEGLSWRSLRVHPTAVELAAAAAPDGAGPIRIGFVGAADAAAGWPAFQDLSHHLAARADLALFQFAAPDGMRPTTGVRMVAVIADASAPMALAEAIAAADIDLALLLPRWDDPSDAAALAALAAGADVVCISGGAAEAVVRATGRGVVLRDIAALLPFFTEGQADAYVAVQRAAGRARAGLLPTGGSAGFDPLTPTFVPSRFATTAPALLLRSPTQVLDASQDGANWAVDLPYGTEEVEFLSRHAIPAVLDPASSDRRRLGVALTDLTLDGSAVPAYDARRLRGWHAVPDSEAPQWTNGAALLRTDGARRLGFRLAAGAIYRRCRLITGG